MKKILYGVLFSLMLSIGLSAQSLPDAPTPKIATDIQIDKGPAHSNPYAIKDPYWNNHRVDTAHYWEMFGLMGGSVYAHYKGGAICRENNGVEPCTAHYGAFTQTEVVDGIISVGTGAGVYYLCRRDTHNSKWCDLVPSIVIGLNTGWGIHEALINKPDKK